MLTQIKPYPKLKCNSIVSYSDSENIKNYLMNSDIKWAFAQNTVSSKFSPNYNYLENLVDTWQLVSLTASERQIHDQTTFEIIRPILDNFIKSQNIKDLYLHKIKINTLFQKENYSADYFNCPHQDSTDLEFSTLLYYVNDSDGDTVFFSSDHDNQDTNVNLKIEEKVSPKQGSAIVFKSNQYHASSNPINAQRRLVINIVFKSYE